MPSQSARQRNKRALATTGSASKIPARSSSGTAGPTPPRLRSLLSQLLLTSLLLVGLQAARFYFRGSLSALSPLSAWTKSKYSADSKIASAASKLDRGATGFNPLSLEGAVPGAPALVPGLEVVDYEKFIEQEGEIEVQYDEEGNMDMATAQRMLDLLYRPAKRGAKVAGRMAVAMIEDEIDSEAADDAEVQDELAP